MQHEKHNQHKRKSPSKRICKKLGKKVIKRFGITDHIGDDSTRTVLVEVTQGKALNMFEQINSNRSHNRQTNLLQHDVLIIGQTKSEQHQPKVAQRHEHNRARIRAGDGHITINSLLYQPRLHQINQHHGHHQRTDKSKALSMRFDIGKQGCKSAPHL